MPPLLPSPGVLRWFLVLGLGPLQLPADGLQAETGGEAAKADLPEFPAGDSACCLEIWRGGFATASFGSNFSP
ncbi:MAG: hypothetical protein JNN01_05110 [Opitutaceae bacterium]|nr:hypothetical protein [Opitutaceae bacterium]